MQLEVTRSKAIRELECGKPHRQNPEDGMYRQEPCRWGVVACDRRQRVKYASILLVGYEDRQREKGDEKQ